MLQGLRDNGVDVIECHCDIWGGIEDKSLISSWRRWLRLGLKWLCCYPGLIVRYLRLPDHDRVVVGYLGLLDLLVLWPLAKSKGVPIVWDAFVSLYNTVVEDRRLFGRLHPLAILLFWWEWLVCRLAGTIILDTAAHGQYFTATFKLSPGKVRRVFVGAELELFRARQLSGDVIPADANSRPFTVLFYGQYTPLHGIKYIVEAAKLTASSRIQWLLIGDGQEKKKIEAMLGALAPGNVTTIPWVPYRELGEWLQRAHICLGIFGETAKAQRVIPNKVFQILAAGRPLITADTPAIRELLGEAAGVVLVPAADPTALASAVLQLSRREESYFARRFHAELGERISPAGIGRTFVEILNQCGSPPLG